MAFTAVTDAETNEKLANAMSNMKPPMDKMPPMGDKMPPKGEMPPKDFQGKPEGKPDMKKGEMPDFAKMPSKAGIGDAPLTIVVSCKEGSELDAGLAVQNMSAEAQLLGYGTKIMTAPTMALNNDECKSMLDIPEGQKIVAVLIVGKAAEEKEDIEIVGKRLRIACGLQKEDE